MFKRRLATAAVCLGLLATPYPAAANTLSREDDGRILTIMLKFDGTLRKMGPWLRENPKAKDNPSLFFCFMTVQSYNALLFHLAADLQNETKLASQMIDKADEKLINDNLAIQIPLAAREVVTDRDAVNQSGDECAYNAFIAESAHEINAVSNDFIEALNAIQHKLLPQQ